VLITVRVVMGFWVVRLVVVGGRYVSGGLLVVVGRSVSVTPGNWLVVRRVVCTRVTVVICGGCVVRLVVGRTVVITVVTVGRMVRRVVGRKVLARVVQVRCVVSGGRGVSLVVDGQWQ